MDLALIKKVLDSEEGRGLKEFLLANMLSLKDIDNLEEKSTPTQNDLERKAALKAYKILVVILDQIVSWSEADLVAIPKGNDWGVDR